MRLPGPLGWLSLATSVVLATAPAAMAVFMFIDGRYGASVLYLGAAVVMFAIPELLLRVIPGPRDLVRSVGRWLLDTILPWRRRSSTDGDE